MSSLPSLPHEDGPQTRDVDTPSGASTTGSATGRKPPARTPAKRKAPSRKPVAKTAAAAAAPTKTIEPKPKPPLRLATENLQSEQTAESDSLTPVAPMRTVAEKAKPAKPPRAKRTPKLKAAADTQQNELATDGLVQSEELFAADGLDDATFDDTPNIRLETVAQTVSLPTLQPAVQPIAEPVAKPAAPGTQTPLTPTEIESAAAEAALAAVPAHKAPTERVLPAVRERWHPVAPDPNTAPVVLSFTRLRKSYGATMAVDGISLDVRAGSMYGIVGPNGAGKTTTLSMITGLLQPDSGSVHVHGIDVWRDPVKAKRTIGVLPDRLRLFDRLTGAQLLYYAGTLRGLDARAVRERASDLSAAFGLDDALNRLVTDYSAGMTKKIALAAAMIHSPRLLVLDEPFESVDPVSAANVIEILQKYVSAGGTVVLSSHGMDLIQRVCDSVAVIVHGKLLDAGTVDDVRGDASLEERFIELAGGRKAAEGMEWLHSFSD